MAGDWIKMTVGLRSHPKVVRMASALKADRLRVIGGLFAVWSVFDQHSPDGLLEGYTLQAIDEDLGWKGFGAAMESIGWLIESDDGLSAPRFEDHNGASAKRRALDTRRKKDDREDDKTAHGSWNSGGQMSASHADKNTDKKRTRVELEKKNSSSSTRGTRLPADWEPGEEGKAFAEKQGLRNGRASAELDKFRDYWASATGQSATKADWQAAWRNWVRKAVEYAQKGGGSSSDDIYAGAV